MAEAEANLPPQPQSAVTRLFGRVARVFSRGTVTPSPDSNDPGSVAVPPTPCFHTPPRPPPNYAWPTPSPTTCSLITHPRTTAGATATSATPPADIDARTGRVLQSTLLLQEQLDTYSEHVSSAVAAGPERQPYTRAGADDASADATLTSVFQNLDRVVRIESVSVHACGCACGSISSTVHVWGCCFAHSTVLVDVLLNELTHVLYVLYVLALSCSITDPKRPSRAANQPLWDGVRWKRARRQTEPVRLVPAPGHRGQDFLAAPTSKDPAGRPLRKSGTRGQTRGCSGRNNGRKAGGLAVAAVSFRVSLYFTRARDLLWSIRARAKPPPPQQQQRQ